MKNICLIPIFTLFCCLPAFAGSQFDEEWEALAQRYLNEMPAFSPVAATRLGDHRFDGQLDQVSAQARAAEVAYQDLPPRDEIVSTAKAQVVQATDFVREHNLVGVPDDPVEVIIARSRFFPSCANTTFTPCRT